jgi:hypothetical protein
MNIGMAPQRNVMTGPVALTRLPIKDKGSKNKLKNPARTDIERRAKI